MFVRVTNEVFWRVTLVKFMASNQHVKVSCWPNRKWPSDKSQDVILPFLLVAFSIIVDDNKAKHEGTSGKERSRRCRIYPNSHIQSTWNAFCGFGHGKKELGAWANRFSGGGGGGSGEVVFLMLLHMLDFPELVFSPKINAFRNQLKFQRSEASSEGWSKLQKQKAGLRAWVQPIATSGPI